MQSSDRERRPEATDGSSPEAEAHALLTPREAECLSLVLELHTNDAIARELNLSVNTVRNHVKSGRDKLGGLGRYDAARRAAALAAPTTGPNGTSTIRTMSAEASAADKDVAAGSSGGAAELSFRQSEAVYDHDDSLFVSVRPPSGVSSPAGRAANRLLSVAASACLIALLIIATPPMAASFERLARLVAPMFK